MITGGSKGLGLAMATEFARSGAAVAMVARDQASLDESAAGIREAVPGASVAAISADIRDLDALVGAHESAVAQLAPIDILVNNAGTSAAGPFESVTDEHWQNDFDLKFFAAVRLMRMCLPHMKKQSWGRIINVLNTAAKAPRANSTPTSVTRAAGMAMTKAAASEYAKFGINVNGMNTGVLVSDQWNRMHQERAPELTFDEFIAKTGRGVPAGRMGDASEFANLACFLASDQSSYVTGTSINIDGGMSPVV